MNKRSKSSIIVGQLAHQLAAKTNDHETLVEKVDQSKPLLEKIYKKVKLRESLYEKKIYHSQKQIT